MRQARGLPLNYPGGPSRVGQVVDADLLARCLAWAGEAPSARNEIFNVANGDVYAWQNVWPAIAEACEMDVGEAVPMSLHREILPREEEWAQIRSRQGLISPGLTEFVGHSFENADYQMGYGCDVPPPLSFSFTSKLHEAGFHEAMDSERIFAKCMRAFREQRLF